MTALPSYEHLLADVAGGVATVTLNRPAQFNALNLGMAEELNDVAIRLDEDADVRAVVITGAGKAFFAGGDLAAMDAAGDERGRLLKHMTVHFHSAVSKFNRMNAPVIASVNGVAAGAGFSLMMSTDLAIAARSATFTMAYTRAGLTPDGSSSYFLPRIVGIRRAQELTLTNRVLSAEEALAWGLVNQVVDDEELPAATAALASSLASGPTRTFGASTRLMREGINENLETQMEWEAREIAAAAQRDDGLEGIAAFLGKRRPDFTGR